MGKVSATIKKAKKATREASLNRIRRLIAGSTMDPAVDFRRFNIAGMDHKGQRNSGFGEAGLGVSAGVEINAGNLVAPGVFRASLSGSVTLQGSPRCLLVVQRDARRVCTSRVTSAAAKADWTNTGAVSLHMLEGTSFEGVAGIGANFTLGIGSPLAPDENGLAIGAMAAAEATVQRVDLEARRPQYYVSPHAAALEQEFNALINNRIKQSIALFVAAATRSKSKKSAAIAFLSDLPEGPLDARIEQILTAPQIPGMRERLDQSDLGWSASFGWIVKNAVRFWNTRNLKSQELLGVVMTIRWEIDQKLAVHEKIIKQTRRQAITGEHDDGTALTPKEAEAVQDALATWEQAISTSENLEVAEQILRRRVVDKALGRKSGARSTDKAATKAKTITQLRGTAIRGDAMMGAGMKATIELSGVAGASVSAKAVISGAVEACDFFYESTSAKGFLSRNNAAGAPAGADLPRVTTREHTQIDRKVIAVEKQAIASAHGFAGSGERKKSSGGAKELYGTIVYRSVRFCRFEGETTTLPNGSGVSMGLSVKARRLIAYGRACRAVQLGQTNFPEPAEKVEKLLLKTLCVDRSTLRGFFAEAWTDDVWPDELDEDVALLVEANFQLQLERLPFAQGVWLDLMSGDAAKQRFDQKKPDANLVAGNGSTRLQVIRIRLRQTQASRKQRNIVGYGSMGPADGDYETKAGRQGWALSLFRSYSAGVENTIDLCTRFYGEGADAFNADPAFGFEYTVAPVMLFNF